MKYKHYKGGIYTYICDAILEWCPNDPNSRVIVYKGKDGEKWVRPWNDFFGYTKSGERRFVRMDEVILGSELPLWKSVIRNLITLPCAFFRLLFIIPKK